MALVLGTNCGFVTAAPVANPAESNASIDGLGVALKDTTHVDATTIEEIGFWINSQGDTGQNWEVGIFDDDTNHPDDLLAGADILNVLPAGNNQWVAVVGLNIIVSGSTVYWIGLQVDASVAAVGYDITGTGEGSYYFATLAALPATYPAGTNTTRNNSVYALYTTGGGPIPGQVILISKETKKRSYMACLIPFLWLKQGKETRRGFIRNTIASILGV